MSRKSVLIAQLAEDEAIKDAFRQFAARIVNTSKLSSMKSSFPLENYMQSALNSSSDDEEEEDDEESCEELCECKCQRNIKHKNNTIVIKETNNKEFNIKDKKTMKRAEKDIITFVSSHAISTQTNSNNNNNNKYFNDNNNHCENCECIACEKIKKSNEIANKLIADEEKKKKKSEKKKLKKKKNKNKRKAEKQSNICEEVEVLKNEVNIVSNEGINNNITKKVAKTENNNNNNNKSIKENKKKNKNSETNNQNVKQKVNNKETDKTNVKSLAISNNRESEKISSNKSSPKSDRENDVTVEAEEEELSFSSAYVSQIAQRKSKPSKTAQTLSEAQDYSHFDDSLKNSNNFITNNTNNSNDNNNFNTIKTNKEMAEELPKIKIIGEQKQKPTKISKEVKLQNIEKSIELAIVANQKAENHKFNEAIDLFTEALVYNPSDYRFYVNRSYCFDSIQDFRSALKDAEIAIQLRSDWPKCHYRKGKALAGLKNYQEAEIALKKVIALEKDCDEALSELWHVRYGAIIDMGYDTSAANAYASQYDTIKDALEALSIRGTKNSMAINSKSISSFVKKPNDNPTKNGLLFNNGYNEKSGEIWADDDIYISDDEYISVVKNVDFNSDESLPTNPFGWKALWVGNVSLNAKLETLTTMFRKFGNLNYCNVFKGNNGGNFVLVHYDNPESPTLAMTKYKGKIIPGVSISDTALEIRFRPNKDQKKPNYDQRLESDECYYWRTTGCARGDKCLYKHIPANKGVDRQAWMCAPLKKGLPHNAKSLK